MRRKLFTTAFSFALTAVVVLAAMALMPAEASAFEQFAGGGNCEGCHTTGFNGIGDPLHDLHTPMIVGCSECHPAGGGGPATAVLLDPSGNGQNGCVGCHVGTGLRTFHRNNSIADCAGCHTSPESPPAENVAPPLYGSTTAPNVVDPCNTSNQQSMDENWDGNNIGLDNDGDLLYDGNDPDCGGTPVGANYNSKTGAFTSTETKVGGKAYNVLLNQQAGPGFNFALANAQKITPTGSPSCTYTGATGVLECPVVTVTGSMRTYNVIMDQTSGFNFTLRSAKKNP